MWQDVKLYAAIHTVFLILPYLVTDGQEFDASEDKTSLFPSHDQEKSLVELRQQREERVMRRCVELYEYYV